MRHAMLVAWKEFRTFFQTPIAYVILFIFTVVGGWWFFKLNGFFAQREASVRGLMSAFPWLFLFFAPAITMRVWAEERRAGTIETLLTLPLRDWEITLGKFLASTGLIVVWLVSLLPLVGVIYWFGEPDKGPIIAGFLGALLLGCSYASIGVAASALTENQIIALVLSFAVSFFFFLVGFEAVYSVFPEAIGGFLHNVSLQTHFQSITRGVIDSRDLLYYVSFTAFFLVLNHWLIRRRRGGGTTVALAAGVLLLANYLTTSHFFRIDLTQDARYTLAEDTKRILKGLDDDLRITAYLSKNVPSDYANLMRDFEDKVKEFEQLARPYLRAEIADTDSGDKQKEAAKTAGIQAVQLPGQREDELNIKLAYLGVVVEYGGKTEKVPVVNVPTFVDTLEYELIRRIAKVTRRTPTKIAWQVNDPMAGMNIPGMQRPPSGDKHGPGTDMRQIDQFLKEENETTSVDLKSRIPDDVKVVVLCNAEGLTDVQKFWVDQFLMRGGGLIVCADGSAPQSMGGMGGPGSPTMRAGNDRLPDDLFSHYGFKINKDVVLDLVCERVPYRNRIMSYPPFIRATAANIDATHPISASFRNMFFTWVSSISLTPKPGVKAVELVKSSEQAKHLENFMMLEPESLLPQTQAQVEPWKKEFKNQYVLVGILEGDFQSYFVAHEVPKEIVSGKPAVDPDPGNPFGAMGEDPEPKAHAKSATPDAGSPDPKKDDAKKEDATPKGDDAKKEETKPDGGPRADGQDVPGGGFAPAQDAPAPAKEPAPAPAPAPAAQDGDKKPAPDAAHPGDEKAGEKPADKTEPAKPFEYLKQSTAPGKILVIGTADFASDSTLQGALENAVLIQNAAGYMTSDGLTTLRAKRLTERPFEPPNDTSKAVATLLGWFATPLLLLLMLVVVHMWRRVWRPAASRRRAAAAAAAH
jgi:ABC-type transport system involved in multi-copper enzyme maturation permease subunit